MTSPGRVINFPQVFYRKNYQQPSIDCRSNPERWQRRDQETCSNFKFHVLNVYNFLFYPFPIKRSGTLKYMQNALNCANNYRPTDM